LTQSKRMQSQRYFASSAFDRQHRHESTRNNRAVE
jgi:hypothetical protein